MIVEKKPPLRQLNVCLSQHDDVMEEMHHDDDDDEDDEEVDISNANTSAR